MANGKGGLLKILAALSVVLVGGLALLTVLDLVPREVFTALSVKVVLVALILGAVGVVLGFLFGRRGD
jgi:hypothetical protein